MTTPKITYAHLLTEPNPKHVESLIKFFESGCQQRGTGGVGGGNEHLFAAAFLAWKSNPCRYITATIPR